MTAAGCRCISQSRSLICPSCKKCFCNASKLFRNQFWRDAPDALCEARDAQRPTEDQIPPVLKKPLVLVVDDDAAIRLLTAELVTRF
ncbi:MAG: hypothetical protein R3338_01575, partial [Thermoanaerobaculia bacterium]|nr:hypothetical protein [Thermoanaerobaculia bacterium]